jgi:hypothetical protein
MNDPLIQLLIASIFAVLVAWAWRSSRTLMSRRAREVASIEPLPDTETPHTKVVVTGPLALAAMYLAMQVENDKKQGAAVALMHLLRHAAGDALGETRAFGRASDEIQADLDFMKANPGEYRQTFRLYR